MVTCTSREASPKPAPASTTDVVAKGGVEMRIRKVAMLAAALLAACGGGGGSGPDDGVTARDDFNGIAAADMNRDGLTDLVAARFSIREDGTRRSHIVVLLQDAARPGRFGTPREYPYAPTLVTPQEIVAADLQGDGLPDVVASGLSEAGFRVFLNDPAAPGTLLPGTHYGAGVDAVGWPKLAVADMDGDARPDVVIADDSLLVYYPQGAASPGSFLGARTIGAGFEGVGVGDLDGDGLIDAATFEGDWQNSVPDTLLCYRQNPAAPGQFLAGPRIDFGFSGTQIAVADLDGDGRRDFAVSGFDIDSSYNLHERMAPIYQLDPDFVPASPLSTRGRSVSVRLAVADLDGDGQLEIVVGGTQVRIYGRTAAGSFALTRSLAVPEYATASCSGVVVADLNDDAQPDIAVSMGDISEGRIFVFFAVPGQPGAFAEAIQVAPAP